MLLHIRTRIYSLSNLKLVDLEVAPLGLKLIGDVDLVTRRPYPNKRYSVACRKIGGKAIDGIFIETPGPIDECICVARWAVRSASVVTHTVHYRLLDQDFDAASDDMVLWYASSGRPGEWSSRWPAWAKDLAPCEAEPFMEVMPRPDKKRRETADIERSGYIVSRHQIFAIPTIERERLLTTRFNHRLPAVSEAFRQR